MKKLILAFAIAAAVASPAFAQSFNPSYGTGNELPFRYPTSSEESQGSALAAHAEVSRQSSQLDRASQAAPQPDESCFLSPSSMNFTSCRGD